MMKRTLLIEITAGVIAIGFLIYILRPLLLLGEVILPHDHIYWGYPIFQFFAENIANGHFPLWNPFTHGGEPFYPLTLMQKFIGPIPLLVIYVGKFFTNNIILLYNWNHILQDWILALGIYILLRPVTKHWLIRLTLIPILLYSSITLGSFQQASSLYHFIWSPYIIYFLFRIVYNKDYAWPNWLALAVFIGLNWQSYFFAGSWVALLFFFLAVLLFQRELVKSLFKNKKNIRKLTVAGIIISAMMLPNIILMLEKDKYVFPARMIEPGYERQAPQGFPQQFEAGPSAKAQGTVMPYSLILSTGTFASIWDFIRIASSKHTYGIITDTYIYLGLLPWVIALLGLVIGRHPLKRIWLFLFCASALLSLGPAGILHRLLYYIYPPLWFMRHTNVFLLLFSFAILYFYVLGMNHIYSAWGKPFFPGDASGGIIKHLMGKKLNIKGLHKIAVVALFSGAIVSLVYWTTKLNYPAANFLFFPIILLFVIGWFLRNELGKKGIYCSLIAGHLILATIFSSPPTEFMVKALLLLGIPAILFLVITTNKKLIKQPGMRFILSGAFVFSLSMDFNNHLQSTAHFYGSQRHSSKVFNLKSSIQQPVWVEKRDIAADGNYGDGSYSQSLRYLSLVYRQPYIFSPLMTRTLFSLPQDFLLDSLKNNSLCLEVDNAEMYRNSYLTLSAWVKSQNRAAYAVQMYFQDNISPEESQSYQNSGQWEYLQVSKYIDTNATKLLLGFRINNKATAPAQIRETELKTDFPFTDQFEKALYGKRWNSFLLRKQYFELIHSEIPVPALKEMFAVEKPIFQFKEGIVEIKEDKVAFFLRKLGPEKAAHLLEKYALVNAPLDSSLNQLKISPTDYERMPPEPKKQHPEQQSNKFSYSIKKYNYDTFDIEVFSNKKGIFYWSDGYDPNWHAYLNGKEIPVYPANINFKAIILPKGISQIKFVYQHFLFKASLVVFYGVLVISTLLTVIPRFNRDFSLHE